MLSLYLGKECDCVSDENPGLLSQHPLWPDDLCEDVLPHVGVNGGEGVVEQVHVGVVVHGSEILCKLF